MALAARENGTIINADASQVYRDLRILTARPSAQDEAAVPHLLYGYRDGARPCSAVEWAVDAARAIADVVEAGRLPVLVGGTGLYIRTLVDGIAPVPEIDPDLRQAVRALAPGAAHAALMREDPAAAARLHPNDTARSQRALEVVRATGRSLLTWREERSGGIGHAYKVETEVVDPPLADLYRHCDLRVEQMIAAGAINEVARLLDRGLPADVPVMKSIGVAPLADYLAGHIMLDAAISAVQQATRNYAKRQRTWFRHQLKSGIRS